MSVSGAPPANQIAEMDQLPTDQGLIGRSPLADVDTSDSAGAVELGCPRN